MAAHKRDVPYQSLIRTWLAERLDASREPSEAPSRGADRLHSPHGIQSPIA